LDFSLGVGHAELRESVAREVVDRLEPTRKRTHASMKLLDPDFLRRRDFGHGARRHQSAAAVPVRSLGVRRGVRDWVPHAA